jgi:hypothetical protein
MPNTMPALYKRPPINSNNSIGESMGPLPMGQENLSGGQSGNIPNYFQQAVGIGQNSSNGMYDPTQAPDNRPDQGPPPFIHPAFKPPDQPGPQIHPSFQPQNTSQSGGMPYNPYSGMAQLLTQSPEFSGNQSPESFQNRRMSGFRPQRSPMSGSNFMQLAGDVGNAYSYTG